MKPRAALLDLLVPALLLTGVAGVAPAAAQFMPNRAPEYPAGERPWLQCAVEQSLDVDFEGAGEPYRVEWRRCGPRQAEWKPAAKTIDYPSHYVTVARDAASPAPLVVFDNTEDESTAYIQSVRTMQLTRDAREQLVIVEGIYGTGAAWDLCALGLVNGALACWEMPSWGPAIAPLMASDEESWKSLLISVADDRLLVEAQIYDRAHDANCCPSRGSIFVELRPADGRFDVGRVWRAAPEKGAR